MTKTLALVKVVEVFTDDLRANIAEKVMEFHQYRLVSVLTRFDLPTNQVNLVFVRRDWA